MLWGWSALRSSIAATTEWDGAGTWKGTKTVNPYNDVPSRLSYSSRGPTGLEDGQVPADDWVRRVCHTLSSNTCTGWRRLPQNTVHTGTHATWTRPRSRAL